MDMDTCIDMHGSSIGSCSVALSPAAAAFAADLAAFDCLSKGRAPLSLIRMREYRWPPPAPPSPSAFGNRAREGAAKPPTCHIRKEHTRVLASNVGRVMALSSRQIAHILTATLLDLIPLAAVALPGRGEAGTHSPLLGIHAVPRVLLRAPTVPAILGQGRESHFVLAAHVLVRYDAYWSWPPIPARPKPPPPPIKGL